MTEGESEIPTVNGMTVTAAAKAANHYRTLLLSDRKAPNWQREVDARAAFFTSKGVHPSWWKANGLNSKWDKALLHLKKEEPTEYEQLIKKVNLALPISSNENQPIRELIDPLQGRNSVKKGSVSNIIEEFFGVMRRGNSPFPGSENTGTFKTEDPEITRQKKEEEALRKMMMRQERADLQRQIDEEAALIAQEEEEEREAKLREVREHAREEATKLANLLYTPEGREQTEKLLDDLVSVAKGRFDKLDRVRKQVLYQVDQLGITASTQNITQYSAGRDLLNRWRTDHPIKDGGYKERDKVEREIFIEKTEQYRAIAHARRFIQNGSVGVPMPRTKNSVHPLYTELYQIEVYRNTFNTTWNEVKDNSDLINTPAWFVPS